MCLLFGTHVVAVLNGEFLKSGGARDAMRANIQILPSI